MRQDVSAPERSFEISNWTNNLRQLNISDGPPAQLRIATFYYPFWKAFAGDGALDVQPANDGSILVDVPSRATSVTLTFVQPSYETYSRYFSIVAWLALLITAASSLAFGTRAQLK